MSLDERKALQCKGNLRQLGMSLPREGLVESFLLDSVSSGSLRCPASSKVTYLESVREAVGKPGAKAVLTCAGENHVLAGYGKDYPRWVGGQGLQDNAEGAARMPSALQLPLPEDAMVLESWASQGQVHLVLSTAENLQEWAEKYNALLNPGSQLVSTVRGGRLDVSGNFSGIPYSVSTDLGRKTVTIVWDPITEDVAR